MTRTLILCFLIGLGLTIQSQAQELSYGFNVGLNFSTITGPSEQDNGNNLESNGYNMGFHIGGGVILKFVDRFGIKGEILFSQKGGEYRYDGPSYFIFETENGNQLLSTGNRKTFLDITNSYIDIPILGYAKFNKIEFSGGINIGFLVSASAIGSLDFEGNSVLANDPTNINSNLNYNFFQDEIDGGPPIGDEFITFSADGQVVEFPTTLDAYFDFNDDDGRYYNVLDLGLNAGISYFINKGLFVGVRANYGLIDVNNNAYDISLKESDGFNLISREDKDVNFSIQTSVGFTF